MRAFVAKRFYFLKLALSEFHVHRKRFSLTALAIAWGTCTILLLLGFGEGLKIGLMHMRYAIGDNVILVWGGRTSMPHNGLPAGRRIRFGPDDITYIRDTLPEIKSISGAYRDRRTEAIAGTKEGTLSLYGVDADYGRSRNLEPQKGGRFLNDKDVEQKRRVIFMGWEVVKKFYPEGNPVGKQIIINKVPFTIIGLLEPRIRTVGFGSRDKDKSYIPFTTYSALMGDTYFDHVLFSVGDPADAEYIKRKLYYLFGSKHNFNPEDENCLHMWETVRMIERYSKMGIALQVMMGTIGILTLLISGVGLANIMYASISRRTREIGIKIAIGAHPKQVLWQIVCEAFFFSLAGGLLGGGTAILVAEVLRHVPIEHEALQFLNNPRISMDVCIVTTCALAVITFFAGFFPARRAAMQNPIESLRYE